MNSILQTIIITLSVIYFFFITYFVKKKSLQIKQSLIWYFSAITFIVISIIPELLIFVSELFNIAEPVNAVFFIIIGFLLIIVFWHSIYISKSNEITALLIQELSKLKAEYEGDVREDIHNADNSVNNAGNRSDSMEA